MEEERRMDMRIMYPSQDKGETSQEGKEKGGTEAPPLKDIGQINAGSRYWYYLVNHPR
jgi:hypothetical protein